MSQILQCHERGGDRHSQVAHNRHPSVTLAVLIGTMRPPPMLVSHSTVYVKLPIIFSMMKLPRMKWNVYATGFSFPYNPGSTIHSPNQYRRGAMIRTKVIDSRSLIVRGHTFFRIIIVVRSLLSNYINEIILLLFHFYCSFIIPLEIWANVYVCLRWRGYSIPTP